MRLTVARVSVALAASLAAGASAAACTAGPRDQSARATDSPAARGDASPRGRAPTLPPIDAVFVLDSIGSDPIPAPLPRSAPGVVVLAESIWLRPDGSFTSLTVLRETARGRADPPYGMRDSGRHRWGPPDGTINLTGRGSDTTRRSMLVPRGGGQFLAPDGAVPYPRGGTGGSIDWIYRRVQPRPD
jgi:hypothetical protein